MITLMFQYGSVLMETEQCEFGLAPYQLSIPRQATGVLVCEVDFFSVTSSSGMCKTSLIRKECWVWMERICFK